MEDTPYFKRLQEELESARKNVANARERLNQPHLDAEQMYGKIGKAIGDSEIRPRGNTSYPAPSLSRSSRSPRPETTEVLEIIPVDENRRIEIRTDPRRGNFTFAAVKEEIEFPKDLWRAKDSTQPPPTPVKVAKDIASMDLDDRGHVGFVRSGYSGAKEQAVDRLMMEASKRNMTPHSSNLLEPGKKLVTRVKEEYENSPKEKYLQKIQNFLSTGKTGKIWGAVAPVLKPLGMGASALGALGYSDPSAAAVDMVLPGGLEETNTSPEQKMLDQRYLQKLRSMSQRKK